MKKIFFILFIINICFANDYRDSLDTLHNLLNIYSKYIQFLQKFPNNKKQIKTYEQLLITQEYKFTSIPLIGDNNFKVYELNFFRAISDNPQLSHDNKLYHAQIDVAKINTMLFMITNLNQFYKNKQEKNNYKILFKNSECKLLSLAKQALMVSTEEAEILSTEFNLIIQNLSAIPFPSQYGFYRRRMMFSIDTPVAAQNEIDRLTKSLQNLK